MFEQNTDRKHTKTITMVMIDAEGMTEIRRDYHVDATWHEIASQFRDFLCGMGYIVNHEDVGAEW